MTKPTWARIVAFVIIAFVNGSCTTTDKDLAPSTPPGDKKLSGLSRFEAERRAAMVSQVNYQLHFDFRDPSLEEYTGKSTIDFFSHADGRDLRIDFVGGTVKAVTLNQEPIEYLYNGHFIVIPSRYIKSGPISLSVDYAQKYGKTGRGLSRFIDPIDKNIYLTTQFEPYEANRAFPCFDQPDLKATYAMTAVGPKPWYFVSSTREEKTTPQADGSVLWTFPRSAKFSTYIFSLHAGPFTRWEDSSFRIPLRLFARASMAKYVNHKEWFPITRHGFDFFEKYFSSTYPYKKYDQLLIPEFNAGAMENVGAVTFNERFIARGNKTKAQLRGLTNVILHEMAHMWFGNLVTMKWWGDLWLNESFATYMSFVAMAAHPDYHEAWRIFFAQKGGAYFEDQLTTTHPVVSKVDDTEEAFTSFDSITYGKGAAVLKQLSYTLGEDAFKKGLKTYFERYAEKNTEYKDFMGAMAEASQQELNNWQKTWFETAGLNTIAAEFACQNGVIEEFKLKQTPISGQQINRPHQFKVALLNRKDGQVNVSETLNIKMESSTLVIAEAKGKICPDVVYPNYEDHGYFKVNLDEKSVNNLKISLNQVSDPLLRQQLWYAMWDKVRDGELSFLAYGDLIMPEALANENDDMILRQLFSNISRRPNASLIFYYQQAPTARKEWPEYAAQLDKIIWQRLSKAKAGSDEQLVWLEGAIETMTTSWGLNQLKGLLREKFKLPGLKIDQDRRWDIVTAVSRDRDPEASAIIKSEAARDPSSAGVESKIGAQAIQPNFEQKLNWVKEYKMEKSQFSFAQFRAALVRLFPANQYEMRQQYAKQFFADMLEINSRRQNFAAGLFTVLAPWECDEASKGTIENFLKTEKNLLPVVKKNLSITSQEGARCRNIVGVAEAGGRFSKPN